MFQNADCRRPDFRRCLISLSRGGAADNAQRAFMWALAYEFLWRQLAPEPRADDVSGQ